MAPVGIANAGDPAARTPRRSTWPGPPVELRPRGRWRVRRRRGRGDASGRDGRRRWSTRRSASAHDGTRAAIEAVVEAAARQHGDWRAALATLRTAIAPFDTVGPDYREPALDARRPSRTKSIEELPVALGLRRRGRRRLPRGRARRRSTTAATPTRSRPWPGRSPVPSAAPRPSRRMAGRRVGGEPHRPRRSRRHDGRGRRARSRARRRAARARRRAMRRDRALRPGRVMPRHVGRSPRTSSPHALVAERLDGCDVGDVASAG